MKPTSHKVSDSLFLVRHPVDGKAEAKPADVQTNHIAIIDCSGSMSGDLPGIREQLKRRLPKLLKDGDTISLIWFSSRGEYGVLLEAEPVATLADLKDVNAAIDRWLRPVGMTGFKEPFEEVTKLTAKVAKKCPKGVFALFFMSDGCDNCWPRPDVLRAVDKAAACVASTTIVEYGYYADRQLLSQMAERAGGSMIFAEDFDRYAPTFESAMQRRLKGGKKVEVNLGADAVGGFAYAMSDGELLTFAVEGGKVTVPEGTCAVHFLSPSPVGSGGRDVVAISKDDSDPKCGGSDHKMVDAGFAAVSLYAQRMKPDVVLPLLKSLGDVRFISDFAACFGKQRYSEFMDATKGAAFTRGARYASGWDPNRVPREDAFTVLELLQILEQDEDNRVLLDHQAFRYSRIGRGRVDAAGLTDADLEKIAELTARLGSTKDVATIKSITAEIDALTAGKADALKFVADPAADGYPIDNLVYNEERPNVSFQVRKSGTVDLSKAGLPKGSKVPQSFPTFIFRNYTVIKDGLVNIDVLPVRMTTATAEKIVAIIQSGRASSDMYLPATGDGVHLINLRALPTINRKMVGEASARYLFELEYELAKTRAIQKVFNSSRKELLPEGKKSDGFAVLYGADGAEWLKGHGFTDYSGFNSKQVQAPSTDFYMGKELAVSLKGLSSLPSLKDVRDRMAKGKMTPSAALMVPAVKEVDAFLASAAYTKAANKERLLAAWLDGEAKAATSRVRQLLFSKAQLVFTVVVGQIWFKEFSSLDENTMAIQADGQQLDCKVEMKEVQVRI